MNVSQIWGFLRTILVQNKSTLSNLSLSVYVLIMLYNFLFTSVLLNNEYKNKVIAKRDLIDEQKASTQLTRLKVVYYLMLGYTFKDNLRKSYSFFFSLFLHPRKLDFIPSLLITIHVENSRFCRWRVQGIVLLWCLVSHTMKISNDFWDKSFHPKAFQIHFILLH